ncbi:GNAT family acetyltransferase [Purpureocillium lavendulum]|uniref:GNAT family acetyltransferase n=1 Tax=Purpureocillium lavendulum TaxID=1247861 RepID=A0AB34FRI7_9HYPO|nr:GNAT family acetyltransferase [Purpureocillium lavendulum]
MAKPRHRIQALALDDVPAVAQLCGDAFETDRQTEMKGLGKEPFDMKKYTLESLPGLLKNPRIVVLKVVDEETGDIMGYCTWGFRGFPPDEMPAVEGRTQPGDNPPKPAPSSADKNDSARGAEPTPPAPPETDPIKRLEALTGADMDAWMAEVMPEGTRCIFVVGLSVSPKYQGRGVGSTLLGWGTDFCDDKGVFAWVHSSEPAWKMYEKSGFRVIRSLDVDLDEYAPMPPPNEGLDAKWGHYVFRYMKYFPKS